MSRPMKFTGMAQRGGSVTAQIRFGEEVLSPLILEGTADALGALEPIEALRYSHYLKPEGAAVVASRPIIPVTVSSGQAVYPADVEERLRRTFPASSTSISMRRRLRNSTIRKLRTRFFSAPSHPASRCRTKRGAARLRSASSPPMPS